MTDWRTKLHILAEAETAVGWCVVSNNNVVERGPYRTEREADMAHHDLVDITKGLRSTISWDNTAVQYGSKGDGGKFIPSVV